MITHEINLTSQSDAHGVSISTLYDFLYEKQLSNVRQIQDLLLLFIINFNCTVAYLFVIAFTNASHGGVYFDANLVDECLKLNGNIWAPSLEITLFAIGYVSVTVDISIAEHVLTI